MSRKKLFSVVVILLFILPVLVMVAETSYGKIVGTLSSEKCSAEVENLKLCTDVSGLIVNSGDPIILKLSWVNSSNNERIISRRSVYSITINDEKGKKLIPVFKQKQMNNSDDQKTEMTKEDIEKFMRNPHTNSGSGQEGIHLRIGANQTEVDEVRLTERNDYDLSAKGKYNIAISKTVLGLESGKKIEFIIDNIEIDVK